MKKLLFLGLLLVPIYLFSQPKIQLLEFSTGFDLPLDIAHCGDSRLFVVERDGVIWVLDSLGNRLDTFLNIDPRVNSGQNEQGLLGLAFHPNYAQNGYFFVYYTKNNGGDTRVARFSVRPNNPNEADPNSELTILEQDQPNWNHNGGCLKFGPDGYLYISLGDGGGANDPQNFSQNKKTFLGKILRINVNNSSATEPYIVPADNPFVGNADYFPEIWSLGWRNPWRYSFDRLSGDMWIADVGQNLWEEVDFESANTPGLNYGWRCYEGTHNFNTTGCQPASAYVSPVFEYSHTTANGCSVTGGFVYRGSKYPDLYGYYLFADFCSGRWWHIKRNANGSFPTAILANLTPYEYSGFGEDRNGELYVAALSSGRIYKIKELCSSFQISGTFTPEACPGALEGAINLSATGATGNVTYTWSIGVQGANLVGIDPGIYIVEAKDANNCVRRDTFEIANAAPPTPELPFADTTICLGETIAFPEPTPPAGYTYQWYLNAIPVDTGNFSPVANSFIQLQWIGQTCNSDPSAPIAVTVQPPPSFTLSTAGDTILVNTPLSSPTYEWYFEGNLIVGENGLSHLAEQSGTYTVVASTLNGCTASASINVVVSAAPLPGFVRRFVLSPNPTEQSLFVELELETAGLVSISLADSSQRQVFAQNFEGAKIAQALPTEKLPAGTYFLHVQTPQGNFVRKVVKK